MVEKKTKHGRIEQGEREPDIYLRFLAGELRPTIQEQKGGETSSALGDILMGRRRCSGVEQCNLGQAYNTRKSGHRPSPSSVITLGKGITGAEVFPTGFGHGPYTAGGPRSGSNDE